MLSLPLDRWWTPDSGRDPTDGLTKPSLADLDPDFATKATRAKHPHLAIEALRARLAEESAKATRNNLAREVGAEGNRGDRFTPPLNQDEPAFYDAVATNESAVRLQGDDVLSQIARELVQLLRRDTRTDWTVRDDMRAKMRSSIKRLLVKYKYPQDKQPAAIKLVIEQMEAMAPRFAEQPAP
ncbi:type I restriction enzyme endonuclease domain-containing protein [Skermania piniformis]|nr:type I restriction enzyme endonuclease domain-containing protein [Skermania piniformis]